MDNIQDSWDEFPTYQYDVEMPPGKLLIDIVGVWRIFALSTGKTAKNIYSLKK